VGISANLPAAAHRLPVDDARPSAQPHQRLDDQAEAIGQVVAGAAIESDTVAVLAGDDAEAVVLDLVQPCVPAGRLRRFGRQAGRDEAVRQGHASAIGSGGLKHQSKRAAGPTTANSHCRRMLHVQVRISLVLAPEVRAMPSLPFAGLCHCPWLAREVFALDYDVIRLSANVCACLPASFCRVGTMPAT
jgi:hypothetical protein